MTDYTTNGLTLSGAKREIARFRTAFERTGIDTPDVKCFVTPPKILEALPKNHLQNKYMDVQEWMSRATGFNKIVSCEIEHHTEEVIKYLIVTEEGNILRFANRISMLFENLEIDVAFNEDVMESSRYFIKFGDIEPLCEERD